MTDENGESRAGDRRSGPKCIAIVGPFASGKSTLLEAILARTDKINAQQPAGSGRTVADYSAEARAHQMSTEMTVATTQFMDETVTFLDCPGSVEFAHEADAALGLCDAAIVVVEPDPNKLPSLQIVMQRISALKLPCMMFLNKVDTAQLAVRDTLKMLQPASVSPLLLRQIPLREDGAVVGSIDLALERAYIYREHSESEITEIPGDEKAREIEARFTMLETLADHDDSLMEELLEDIEPPRDQVFDDLSADLRAGHVTPVFLGTAEKGNGALRLLKAIRHDCPGMEDSAVRLGLKPEDVPLAGVMKTTHTTHAGKLSVVRILSGKVKDGMDLTTPDGQSQRVSGVHTMLGANLEAIGEAIAGQVVALGRLENAETGDWLTGSKSPQEDLIQPHFPEPVYSIAVFPKNRKDDVKLSAALKKLCEEDPGVCVLPHGESGQILIGGQGEMHLRIALERLRGKYQIEVEHGLPEIPYRETIRASSTHRGRHKKQSGGHGQFGDVVLDISPLARGEGFRFSDTITGGVVPKQYIPSVEAGVREYLTSGPLGFPVVDVAVNLSDGSYHSVNSSDMAFQMAAKLAMRTAMPECKPVLLEPVMKVTVFTPSEFTAKVTALIPQRRGRILGFDARPDWSGWDQVDSLMPMSDIGDLIIELRSATAGSATYTALFDHMAELTGRAADEVIERSRQIRAA